jgi:hypothetical protein
MFDSNKMVELQHLARDRYQRGGGGGAFKVYASAKAYDESRGLKEMSTWARAVYEASQLWKSDSRSAVSGFRWDCLSHTLDRDGNGDVPF